MDKSRITKKKWLEEQINNFENDKVKTLSNLLSETTKVMEKFLENNTDTNALGSLVACEASNTIFLNKIKKQI